MNGQLEREIHYGHLEASGAADAVYDGNDYFDGEWHLCTLSLISHSKTRFRAANRRTQHTCIYDYPQYFSHL